MISTSARRSDRKWRVRCTRCLPRAAFRVDQQPQQAGNTVTIDPVVRREVQLVEVELYSQRKVMLTRARIHSLGFFEEVDLAMEPTEVPEQLDLEVHVVARSPARNERARWIQRLVLFLLCLALLGGGDGTRRLGERHPGLLAEAAETAVGG